MMHKTKTFVSIVALAALFVGGGIAYAWSAVWHSPSSWISEGSIIDSQKMGESLQYLYDQVTALTASIADLNDAVDGIDGVDGTSDGPGTCVTRSGGFATANVSGLPVRIVACASNETLTGGGCFAGIGVIKKTFPHSNAWACLTDYYPSGTNVIPYAICCK